MSDRNGRTILLNYHWPARRFLFNHAAVRFIYGAAGVTVCAGGCAGGATRCRTCLFERRDRQKACACGDSAVYFEQCARGNGRPSDDRIHNRSFFLANGFLCFGGAWYSYSGGCCVHAAEVPFFEPSRDTFSHDLKAFAYHLKNPVLLLIFGLGVVLQLSFTGMWTYLPFYLEAPPFSLSLETISYMFLAYGLGVVGSPAAGWLAGHFGLRAVRLAGVFVMAVGMLLTLGPALWMIATGLCVTCLGFFTAHSLTASSVGGGSEPS